MPACSVSKWCLTLYSPMDCILPGSSVHAISQARVLQSVAISSCRSSQPRDQTCVSCTGRQILYRWAIWEAFKGNSTHEKKIHWIVYFLNFLCTELCTLTWKTFYHNSLFGHFPLSIGASLVALQYRMCLQCRRPEFDPWMGKIPWSRKWQPTPVFLPGESHGPEEPGRLQSMGLQESDMT